MCIDCGEDCYCDITAGPGPWPCEPLPSIVAADGGGATQKSGIPMAWIRVPRMSNVNQWHNFPVPVGAPITLFPIPWIGWHAIFIKRSGPGPSYPTITPSTVPGLTQVTKEKVVSAGVSLPETGGVNNYWVPVTETALSAQLDTAEWIVIFVRTKSP